MALETPGLPSVVQNDDGTFTATWSPVPSPDGTSIVQYRLWDMYLDEALTSSYIAETSVTMEIKQYGDSADDGDSSYMFAVEVYCEGQSSVYGSIYEKTFVRPSLSAPSGVQLSTQEGDSVTVSWSPSRLSYTSGTVTYYIYQDGNQVAETQETSYRFTGSSTSEWGDDPVLLSVSASAETVNMHYRNLETALSSGVEFTYKSTGSSLAYYSGNGWVNCIAHYYTGID